MKKSFKTVSFGIVIAVILIANLLLLIGCNASSNSERAVFMSNGIKNADLKLKIKKTNNMKINGLTAYAESNEKDFDKAIAVFKTIEGVDSYDEEHEVWIQMQGICKTGAVLLLNADEKEKSFIDENYSCQFDPDDKDSICYYTFDFVKDFVIIDMWIDYNDDLLQFIRMQYSYKDDDDFIVKLYSKFTYQNKSEYDTEVYYIYDKGKYFAGFENDGTYHDSIYLLNERNGDSYIFNEQLKNAAESDLTKYLNNIKKELKVTDSEEITEQLKKDPIHSDLIFSDVLLEILKEQGYLD